MSVEEFELLEAEATVLGLQGLDTLRDWYKKDENSIPPAYFLSVRFCFFLECFTALETAFVLFQERIYFVKRFSTFDPGKDEEI